jgi:hypothetical protein
VGHALGLPNGAAGESVHEHVEQELEPLIGVVGEVAGEKFL